MSAHPLPPYISNILKKKYLVDVLNRRHFLKEKSLGIISCDVFVFQS